MKLNRQEITELLAWVLRRKGILGRDKAYLMRYRIEDGSLSEVEILEDVEKKAPVLRLVTGTKEPA